VKEIIDNIKSLIKNLDKVLKLLTKYNKSKENLLDNAYLAEKNLTEITKITDALPPFPIKTSILNFINDEKEILEKAKDDFRFSFGEKLSDLFKKDGKTIKGQYPTLRVGMYTIKLNFEFGEAQLFFGPEVEKIKSKIPLNPTSIYDSITKFDKELNSEKIDPVELFKDFTEAYKRRLLLTGKIIGEKLPIIEVLNEFVFIKQPQKFFTDPKKENFRDYSRIKLSYLLYILRKSNNAVKGLKFYVATFDATGDKKNSIWIPDNDEGDGTYYSYISIETENKVREVLF
jgi:hypothetical protein